jgi:uncharacterized protein
MSPAARLTTVALLTQGTLAATGLLAASLSGRPVTWGLDRPWLGLLAGLVTAAGLGWVNYRWLYARVGVFQGVKAAVDEVLAPTFGILSSRQMAIVSLAAGVGEEVFFRGWLQPAVGWIPASVVFGAAHVAGARMLALGVWATGMGLVLGAVAWLTGGVLAPTLAHACYDLAAFRYLADVARQQASEGG